MSIADARRIIALENKVADLAEHNRALVARVAALEDHLADFRAAVEARQMLASTDTYPASALQLNAPVGDAEACPSCVRRRDQAQARLRRYRAKIAATSGKTLLGAAA
jgi:hypothetical protein